MKTAGVAPNLETWERAEIERSHVQALLTSGPAPTAASIRRRYAAPGADTPYALEYVYHLLGDVRGRVVLDLGCGDGRDTTLLAGKGAQIFALDLSPDLLQLAGARVRADGCAAAVTLLRGSVHSVPLPDASVDVVLANAILHHVDLALARAEVFRVLRPGGRVVCKEPVRQSRLLRALRPLVPYRKTNISPFERPLLRSELAFFGEPFRRGRQRDFRLPFVPVARLLGAGDRAQHKAWALDARLLARHQWLRAYATVTVFELFKADQAG